MTNGGKSHASVAFCRFTFTDLFFCCSPDVPAKLGPGQIRPRGHRGLLAHGEVKLGLLMTKGQLEVEVVGARNIVGSSKDMLPGEKILLFFLFFYLELENF